MASTNKFALLKRKNLTHLRLAIQTSFTLFCLYAGYQFYRFYLWAMGSSNVFVARPPSVEAFLPISALVSLKRLLMTGVYDLIHPAGLTIFIAAILIALLFRKGFCGWICPVGFTSNLLEKIALKLKTIYRPPVWLDWSLLSLKYLLLGFFAFLILVMMNLQAIEAFNRTPYNLVVDAKMLLFFLEPSNLTLWVMFALLFTSFFLRNFWCRYLCPYGALLGIISLVSPVRIRRDAETCIDCHKCEKVCPGSILVASKSSVNNSECIGCLECVSACPVEDCLSVTTVGQRKLHPIILPLGVLAVFFSLWAWAQLSGHWHPEIPLDVLKAYYQESRFLAHP